jgi:NADPH2:quinone reductase
MNAASFIHPSFIILHSSFLQECPMKAWLMDDYKGVNALRLTDFPDPHPAPNEVILSVEFASLNPADAYLAEKKYPAKPSLPHILGRDGVGKIIALGKDVFQFSLGQRVLILRGETGVNRSGTLAEKVAVPAEDLQPLPPGWTPEQSAAASLVYLTAYQALTQWGDLPPSVVLVTGASGGVGVASIHLGAAMGHTVFGLSRDPAKQQSLKALGAAAGLDPADPNWTKALKENLSPRRVDLIIDTVGGPLFPQLIETLGYNGKVSLVGAIAGPVPSFNTATLFFRRLKIGGVAVSSYSSAESHAAWREILKLLQKTGAKPLVDSVFNFADVKPAFARLAAGPMGKVLVKVDSSR